MLGKKSGIGALVQVEAPQVVVIHVFYIVMHWLQKLFLQD
jgi:hypothetical protein